MNLSIENRSQDHLHPVLEYFIMFAIVFVIIQTFLEELAIIYFWSHDTKVLLIWAGFVFDLLFSLEFILRTIVTFKKGHFGFYFKVQRGWIDLLTSFPLLFLVSGPAILHLLIGDSESATGLAAFLHVLKTAKIVRVTRILRLIRVLKIMGKIQNTESAMTNRHVASVATTIVVSIVVVLVAAQYLPFTHVGDHGAYLNKRMNSVEALLVKPQNNNRPDMKWILEYILINPENQDIIRLKETNTGKVLYEHENHKELIWTAYNNRNYMPVGDTGYEIILSHHPADSEHAKLIMFSLILILVIVLVMMFIFSRQFAQQIADPIFIMNKGLRQWDYNLEVRVEPDFKEDEVYLLARAYNERWLTIKNQIKNYRMQQGQETEEKSAISIDDII